MAQATLSCRFAAIHLEAALGGMPQPLWPGCSRANPSSHHLKSKMQNCSGFLLFTSLLFFFQ